MKTKLNKSVVSACLVAALIIPTSISFAAANNPAPSAVTSIQGDAVINKKEEVIYANLAADGNANAVYAVNHFYVTRAGNIKDYGNYLSEENLTSTDPLTNNGDSISFNAGEGNFYYQGDMATTDLPWTFDISYYLDEVKTAPQDVAGKSGKFEMRIATKENEQINSTFYENYMLQISISLDTEKCGSVQAPGAAIASAGINTIIAYTVMPKEDADIHLTASVKDFTMSGIQISGMPLSIAMELPDTKNMISDFEKLSAAITSLNDGAGELADGVGNLKTGAGNLKNGSADLKNGLSQLSNNSGQLVEASSQINDALSRLASSLGNSSSGEINLGDLNQLPQGLTQLAGGLKDISGGLIELKNGFLSAHTALDAAIQGIPDTAITQGQIDALYADTEPSQHGMLDQLMASYTAGQTVKGTYKQVKGAFDAVGSTINTLSGSIDTIAGTLDDMSMKIEDSLSGMDIVQQLGQLSTGLSELSRNYADFNKGLTDYIDGVSTLAAGYSQFHTGLASFSEGVGDLYGGVVELHDGTATLQDETADMPNELQDKIDDLMAQYTGSDFQPISFVSENNTNISLVQFVLQTADIEKEEKTIAGEPEPKELSFWDRLLSLFH